MIRKLLLGLAATLAAHAQSFEVAAIKPHPGEVTISADPSVRGNRVVGTASTLLDMITGSYAVRYGQVSGGPDWIKTDRFDVDAKAPGDAAPTAEEARAMMRNLLAERFGLQVHRETKQVPIYALVVAKGGLKLKPASPDAPPNAFVSGTLQGLHMESKKGTIEKIATQLSATAGRPVIDRTGITGFYEYSLDWFPANSIPPQDSTVPSMFVAVQELGLRLEPATGPQEMLVNDQAHPPSGN